MIWRNYNIFSKLLLKINSLTKLNDLNNHKKKMNKIIIYNDILVLIIKFYIQ